jgi:hypothetical protein
MVEIGHAGVKAGNAPIEPGISAYPDRSITEFLQRLNQAGAENKTEWRSMGVPLQGQIRDGCFQDASSELA